jgi:hypothetical protein
MSAGSRAELLARGKGPHGMFTSAFGHSLVSHRFSWFYHLLHDSASWLFVRRDVLLASEHQTILSRWCHCSLVT